MNWEMITALADRAGSRELRHLVARQEYWALRKRWYATDFRDWVDKQIKERSGVDVYGEEFRIFGSADAK